MAITGMIKIVRRNDSRSSLQEGDGDEKFRRELLLVSDLNQLLIISRGKAQTTGRCTNPGRLHPKDGHIHMKANKRRE